MNMETGELTFQWGTQDEERLIKADSCYEIPEPVWSDIVDNLDLLGVALCGAFFFIDGDEVVFYFGEGLGCKLSAVRSDLRDAMRWNFDADHLHGRNDEFITPIGHEKLTKMKAALQGALDEVDEFLRGKIVKAVEAPK